MVSSFSKDIAGYCACGVLTCRAIQTRPLPAKKAQEHAKIQKVAIFTPTFTPIRTPKGKEVIAMTEHLDDW